MNLHPALTGNVIMDACWRRALTLDNPGFCVACGNEQGGCEPDARGYTCEACGTPTVYGCEELLLELTMNDMIAEGTWPPV